MNNPVFPEGFDAPELGASNPDPDEGLSKYERKTRRKLRAQSAAEECGLSADVAPEEAVPAEQPPPAAEEYRPRECGAESASHTPTGGGDSASQAADKQAPEDELPMEWLRITVVPGYVSGRTAERKASELSGGVVFPWTDPLLPVRDRWQRCKFELGVWVMRRVFAAAPSIEYEAVLAESLAGCFGGSPFGFSGLLTTASADAFALQPDDDLRVGDEVDRHLLDLVAVPRKSFPQLAEDRRKVLADVWPWFYCLREEIEESTVCEVAKEVHGDGLRSLVPVLPAAVLLRTPTDREAVALTARLRDRIGYAALYCGFGARKHAAGEPPVPLVVDLPADSWSWISAWLQEVADRTYSLQKAG